MANETENVAGIVKRLDDRAHNLHIAAFNNATEDSLRVTLHDFLLFAGDCAHNIAAAHEREVTVLRDALKDAIELYCYTCTDLEEDSGKCKDKDGVCPPVARWRKALEGTGDGK